METINVFGEVLGVIAIIFLIAYLLTNVNNKKSNHKTRTGLS